MPPPAARLGAIVCLEDRSLPSAFGTAWPDAEHVTLSFAPDGTATAFGPSALFTALNKAGATAAWQREVLRAFQTWAVYGNINVGLVADGGQALGAPGAVQGDSRFGDVRVAAAGAAGSEVASAGGFNWTGTTLTGDVLFSTNAAYSIGSVAGKFDVFSVALHEAGHAFGLDHSSAAGSVMSPTYAYYSGLSSSDISAIRALYGTRAADDFDARGSNNTLASASTLLGKLSGVGVRYVADGDLTTLADTDCYKFTAPVGFNAVTVRLQAKGLSLVLPQVTVYDSAGRVVASAVTRDPLNNDLSLTFQTGLIGGTYTVRVTGATEDVFGIGSYRLVADAALLGATLPLLPALLSPVVDGLTNDTLSTATQLLGAATGAPDDRFDANYRGVIESAQDVDVYQIRAPLTSPGGSTNLNVIVWGSDASPLNPRIRVLDALGNPVAVQVLTNDTGMMSVQLQNVTPGGIYYIRVAARLPGGSNGTGAYVLGADFNQTPALAPDYVGGDDLGAGASQTDVLTVNESGTYQFFLAAAQDAGTGGVVTMTITDAAGKVVLVMEATAGQPLSTRVQYLAAGTYRVTYTSRATTTVRHDLYILELTENVGPYAPSYSSSGTSSSGSTTTSSSYTYTGSSSDPPKSSYYTY